MRAREGRRYGCACGRLVAQRDGTPLRGSDARELVDGQRDGRGRDAAKDVIARSRVVVLPEEEP